MLQLQAGLIHQASYPEFYDRDKTLSTRLDINYDIIPVTGLAIYYPV